MYTFSNYTKHLKYRMSVQYELTSWRWGHTQTRVEGGGGAVTHISIESSESEEGWGAVWRQLEVPTSCIREGGGSGAVAAGASHLLAWGRRSGAARGRRKPPVAVSGLPLRVQGVLANIVDLMLKKHKGGANKHYKNYLFNHLFINLFLQIHLFNYIHSSIYGTNK
jgi:hypothetical protein